MNRSRVCAIPLLVAVVAAFGVGITASNHSNNVALGVPATTSLASNDTLTAAESVSAAFESVAETIAPSVVTIRSTKEVEIPVSMQRLPRQFFFNSPFDEFFGNDFFHRFEVPQQPGRRQFQQGEGSGVIVSEDGYILTNSHVVNDADEVTVIFSDDRQYTAEVVGTDVKTDIAVIKIDSANLVAAELGDSDDLRVGQWVAAAGNPFGLSSSITAGIVSATGRSRVGITDYEDFIQTDAAINRGNSGGPLVNLRGEVVGINTAILSRSGGNIGIGFAIPINLAKEVMSELIEDGRVVRGYLGVLIQDLSEGMAESFGYEGTQGALISDVTDNGPAATAGLRPGDIITRFDGKPVTDVAQLRLNVASVDPGSEVELSVFRDGRIRNLEVTIEELPTEVSSLPTIEGSDLNLGMTVETLTPSFAQRYGVNDDLTGVVVTGIEPFGPAGRAGLRRGDVITHVQETPVKSTSDFRRELRSRDLSEGVRLTIQNESRRRFVFLQLRR